MKFVADEGVDLAIVTALRNAKFDVIYIAEELAGIMDQKVLELANSQNRVLITRDKDFGELVFKNKMLHSGIVLYRLHELSTEEKVKLVMQVINKFNESLMNAFTVIQSNKVRIKKLK